MDIDEIDKEFNKLMLGNVGEDYLDLFKEAVIFFMRELSLREYHVDIHKVDSDNRGEAWFDEDNKIANFALGNCESEEDVVLTAYHEVMHLLLKEHLDIAKYYNPNEDSDALFSEMIDISRQHRKQYVHLGLGVSDGVRRFKEKWGGAAASSVRNVRYGRWKNDLSRRCAVCSGRRDVMTEKDLRMI